MKLSAPRQLRPEGIRRLLLVMSSALLCVACAGKPVPDTQRYLLRSDAADPFGPHTTAAVVTIGALELAGYINGTGLVVALDDGTLATARYHQWAEPLRESLRGYLAAEVAAELGKPVRPRRLSKASPESRATLRIDLRVDQLHAMNGGDAVLVVDYALVEQASDRIVLERQFRAQRPLRADGYRALVDAFEALFSEFANAAAAAMREAGV